MKEGKADPQNSSPWACLLGGGVQPCNITSRLGVLGVDEVRPGGRRPGLRAQPGEGRQWLTLPSSGLGLIQQVCPGVWIQV